jgi:hypothetical protein
MIPKQIQMKNGDTPDKLWDPLKKQILYPYERKSFTIEMLLDQIIGLNIIQIAAIPMILLVVAEWVLTIIQKKKTHSLG